MTKFKDILSGRLFLATAVVALGALAASGVASAGIIGTADPNLTSALDAVTAYFGDNIGAVIAAIVSIVVLLWMVSMFFRSSGANKKKPT